MSMAQDLSRRGALAWVAGALLVAPAVRATVPNAFELTTADGLVIRNFAIDPALTPDNLPGVMMAGTATGAPVLYEFFDYACPYCRVAFQELELLLGPDSGLRVGLLHHPVLGANSSAVALVVLATMNLHGDAAALRLHSRLLDTPGRLGAARALAVAESLGLDAARLKAEAARTRTQAILGAQAHRALALGLKSTPAFVLGRYAFLGWPGPDTVHDFVRASQHCGGLACPASTG